MPSADIIKAALLTCSKNVSHVTAVKKTPPYIVYAEDGQAAAKWSDNRMTHQKLMGTVDLYTANLDSEPLVDKIQAALNEVCFWRLNSIQYEDDTKLRHWEWVFEV
jgi:hypothetical protein